jgi:phage recombination protein Bet
MNQRPITSANLPALTSQLADERILSTFLMPPEEAKIKFQMAPLVMLARDNPDLQAMDFINFVRLAQKTGADPELKHIHLVTMRKKVKRFDQVQQRQVEEWVTKGESLFSYHFFVGKAQETGELALMDVVTEPCDYLNPATGQTIKNTVKSTATVIRKSRVSGYEQKYVYRAYFPEFVKTKDVYENNQRTGAVQVTEAWASKPYLMLEKCALANALRWAFEAELGGMYIPEEMVGELSPIPGVNAPKVDPVPVETVLNKAEAVDAAPAAVENESQEVVDTEYHELGQPDPEKEPVFAPPAGPAPTLQEQLDDKAKNSLASNRTKALLWAALQSAGKRGIVNSTDAGQKLTTVTVTEGLATTLIEKLNAGDASWFHQTH